MARLIANPAAIWLYSSEPEENTNGRRILVPHGKLLGGSSSINGMVFVRGQAQDFDTWAQMGNRGWSYAEVLPFFKRMESYAGKGDDAFRAREGPLRVTNPEPRDPLFATIIKAAAEVGIRHNPDYNGAPQEGIAMSQATIASGRRMSTARCYLDPIRKRRNLHIETEALTEAFCSMADVAPACATPSPTMCARPAPRVRSSSAPARSTRRSCWNYPASASPND